MNAFLDKLNGCNTHEDFLAIPEVPEEHKKTHSQVLQAEEGRKQELEDEK
jgi:hypothetical protein